MAQWLIMHTDLGDYHGRRLISRAQAQQLALPSRLDVCDGQDDTSMYGRSEVQFGYGYGWVWGCIVAQK